MLCVLFQEHTSHTSNTVVFHTLKEILMAMTTPVFSRFLLIRDLDFDNVIYHFTVIQYQIDLSE